MINSKIPIYAAPLSNGEKLLIFLNSLLILIEEIKDFKDFHPPMYKMQMKGGFPTQKTLKYLGKTRREIIIKRKIRIFLITLFSMANMVVENLSLVVHA